MDNSHTTPGHDQHAGPDFALYIKIFVGLCILTGISFLSNQLVNQMLGMPELSMVIILLVSVAKATLVAMFFMHLKWDWSRLYFLVIPVVIMGVMMIIVLLPDIVLGWHTPSETIEVDVIRDNPH